jgi:hypothetical protein
MPAFVQTPDGEVVKFSRGTSEDDIRGIMAEIYGACGGMSGHPIPNCTVNPKKVIDLDRIKGNMAKMIALGAPEADIDAYLASEGVKSVLDLVWVPVSPAPIAATAILSSDQFGVIAAWLCGTALFWLPLRTLGYVLRGN